MKKLIEVIRAMFAIDEEDTYIPDIYNVQQFSTNGLF